MIVQSIHALDFSKFRHIALDAPPEGTLAVTGPNESGKSTLAELICLALFGHTPQYPPEAVGDLIRWGASEAKVELAFSCQGSPHTVTRYLGARAQEASLRQEGRVLASGIEAVNRAVENLLGYNFRAFVHTLYLPQGDMENTLPLDTLKAIQGIDVLEAVADDLRREMAREQEAIEAQEKRLTDLQLELMELDYHEETARKLEEEKKSHLKAIEAKTRELDRIHAASERLEQALGKLQQQVHAFLSLDVQTPFKTWQERVKSLQEALKALEKEAREAGHRGPFGEEMKHLLEELNRRLQSFQRLCQRTKAYRQHLAALLGEDETSPLSLIAQETPLMRKAQQLRKKLLTARWTFFLLLLPTLAAWVLWGGTLLPPENPLSSLFPAFDDNLSLGLLLTASSLTLLDAIAYMRTSRLSSDYRRVQTRLEEMAARIENARREAHLLDRSCDLPLPQVVEALGQIMDEGISRALAEFIHGYRNPLLGEDILGDFQETLAKAMKAVDMEVAGIEDSLLVKEELDKQDIASRREAIQRLEEALKEEEERRRTFLRLQESVEKGQQAIASHEQHILERQAALELLQDTCAHIQKQFQQDLADFSGKLLSRLSEGHYPYLHIDDRYGIHVFSREKKDFLPWHGLSAGARCLAALALRLGLAEALVETLREDTHALVLDHPLAFLDAPHTRRVLEILPEVSPAFAQRWIMAPELPETDFSLHIRLEREQDVLNVQGD
ncbi:MAG: SMC family ATPase [Gammaproteobacteria bacterium]|nr:MAG: SMC family ATPase [Gammaproteobacteria bacterium]